MSSDSTMDLQEKSIGDGGFINSTPLDDHPAAMEAEVYIDGQLQVKNKKKQDSKDGKKKKKQEEENYFAEFCSLFRILWATRQTEDIDKVKNPDKYVKVTLRELIIYSVYLVILCIIAFGMISPDTFIFTNLIVGSFITAPTLKAVDTLTPITFATTVNMGQIWRILNQPIISNLYSAWYTTNPNNTEDLTRYIANENRMLGLPRLRQIRVQNNSCVVPDDFKVEIKNCFSDWAPSVDDQNPFGLYYTENVTNVSAWFYQSESQLNGFGYQGLMNYYDGGGFVVDLSHEPNVTLQIFEYLFENLWIDRGTRAVFLDFTIYNANLNLFGQTTLVFELPATGGVVPSHVIRACKLLRYVSSFDYFILVCEFIFCAFVLYYFVEEAIEIKKHKLSYFKSVWNILDVVILIIAAICIGFNIYRQVTVSNLLEGLLQNDNQYVSLQFLCYWQNVFNTAVSIMVFLSWIKIFKYVSFNKTMTQLSMTLSRCAKDVTGFAIMFFIVFLAYAQLGYLVFGTQIHDFSTFSYSIFTLFRIILGDFDFDSMEAANRVLGPIFFLTYVFFVFFVLLNMFIAIINDTYGEIKNEIAAQKSEIELASFFKKGYNRVLDKLNLKKAQIVDIQKAIVCSDVNNDKKIDFSEWRNNLRSRGYGEIEIETLFAKYDLDGDQCLNEDEQREMLKDLSQQNEELKEAYMIINQAQKEGDGEAGGNSTRAADRKRKRTDGVPFEDYSLLSNRIDKMESSIGSITNKMDAVLSRLDQEPKSKPKSADPSRPGTGNSRPRSKTDRSRPDTGTFQSGGRGSKPREETSISMVIQSRIKPMGDQSDC